MEETSGSGIGTVIGLIIYLAVVVLFVVSAWKVYEKAGKPGWAAIIPIYNIIVLMEIIGRPTWWTVLYFIPCVNLVVAILNLIDFAKSFGKSAGYAILFLIGIGYPLLAFSDAKYVGPAAKSA